VAENYRKIRNTFRYVLGNLGDFNPARDAVAFEQMQAIDQYMLRRTVQLVADVTNWYDQFTFHKSYQAVNQFCVVELSSFYFDVLKDRLYTSAPRSLARRSAQTAIWRIGEALLRLVAPLMSFTAEEVWSYLPQVENRAESVHLAMFPKVEDILGTASAGDDPKQAEDWEKLRAVREEVLKALEEARNQKMIGTGLEAQVTIAASDPVYSLLLKYQDQLRYVFIVSAVHLEQAGGNGSSGITVTVAKAAGKKCERCWNYSTHVGEDASYPAVCERCSAVLQEIERGDTA
jgi:isoleucyl-tRNA synthetase